MITSGIDSKAVLIELRLMLNKAYGDSSLISGFDLNSYRINIVIVD
ncbi:MAG: hypothetical protein QXN17_06275 [Nitrososphaerota archaeon]